MPVINMNLKDLEQLIGGDFSLDEFKERVPMMGATVEKIEGEEISVEFFPDRPDLYSVEGVARAYRRFVRDDDPDLFSSFSILGDSGIELRTETGLEKIRPVIGAAVIKGVKINEDALVSIMNLQEKLHLTVGRKRRKVAIGIHDMDPLEPPFRYWAADPEEVSFVPLQKTGEWTLGRILSEHEKGVDYAWTLEGMDKYPLITDSKDQVLSFPPIINGELTRVNTETENIFVDCTGWDLKAVSLSVNIVCSQLIDRGGKLKSVSVFYPGTDYYKNLGIEKIQWPMYKWEKERLDLTYARTVLGSYLSEDQLKRSLRRMGYEQMSVDMENLRCLVPPWRGDILHQADILEDVANGYGYDNFPGVDPKEYTSGSERPITELSRSVRGVMVGLGFLEARTISLSNEDDQFEMMKREEMDHIKITNPITTEHTMMRMSALPSLLLLLKANRHRDLPQRIFEVADVMIGNRNHLLLSAVSEENKASFTEIKGMVQRIMSDLDIPFIIGDAKNMKFYIRGRGAGLFASFPGSEDHITPFPELKGEKDIPLGHFGEIHPRIISDMELKAPVSSFELDLDLISRMMG